jgi:Flp pilus assembly protein TadG
MRVPARPQEPVLPTTSTGCPGGVDPGVTEEMTGVSVTVTVTVAAPQSAPPETLRTSSQRL